MSVSTFLNEQLRTNPEVRKIFTSDINAKLQAEFEKAEKTLMQLIARDNNLVAPKVYPAASDVDAYIMAAGPDEYPLSHWADAILRLYGTSFFCCVSVTPTVERLFGLFPNHVLKGLIK